MISGVSGYVLAGGQSSRMGEDKAFILLGGQTLLEIALAKLTSVCGNAHILCGTAARTELLSRFAPVVQDSVPNLGPMGGVVAALHHAATEWLLVLPVDVPLLPGSVLERWAAENLNVKCAVACFRAEGVVQPLPFLARRAILPVLEADLRAHQQKLRPALQNAARALQGADGFRVTDIGNFADVGDHCFLNLNSPEDRTQAEAYASQMPQVLS